MKKNIYIAGIVVSLALALVPVLLLAQNPGGGNPPSIKIDNPLKVNSVEDLIFSVVDIATTIGFYLAVFFIIYSGFLFVKAQGKPGEIENAKKALIWTIVGTAVLLGARVISEVIQGTIDDIKAEAPQHEIFRV